LFNFEVRAARRHGIRIFSRFFEDKRIQVEDAPVCSICGHIVDFACRGHNE